MKQMYHYNGPFFNGFGYFIGNMEFFTQAVSHAQACNNILYQAKDAMNLKPTAMLKLYPDDVKVVEKTEPNIDLDDYHQITLDELFGEVMG